MSKRFPILRLLPLWALLSTPMCVVGYDVYASSTDYPHLQVCFTPGQDCISKITQTLDTARKSILVQAYSFTSTAIAQHLAQAKHRGLDVRVILDKSQQSQRYSVLPFLLAQHIPVWIDYKPAIAHNKIMIIDAKKVITGSFNFTRSAQCRNAENLLVIQDPTMATYYTQNWERRRKVSKTMMA